MKRENHDRTLAIARLRPDVTLAQARSQMTVLAQRLERQFPATNAGLGVVVTPLREHITAHAKPTFLVLLGAVGFVLLIACVNVANLLLARSLVREREIATRLALGCGRWRVFRQFLAETALLGLAGGILGLVPGAWAPEVLSHLIPDGLPLAGLTVDWRVLAFTLIISVMTALGLGAASAFHVSRVDLNASLKEGGRSGGIGAGHRRIRKLLAISEVALALVLLTSAGLMIQSLRRLLKVDLGFSPEGVLTMPLDMSDPKYDQDPALFMSFNARLLESVRAIPGVQYVGMVRPLPLGGGRSAMPFYRGDLPVPPSDKFPAADWRTTSPGYFQAMGVSLLKGRFFEDSDRQSAPLATVINETMARNYWPSEDPVGKRMRLGTPDMGLPWFTIVGIAHDTRPFGLETAAPAEFYVSCLQMGSWADMNLVVRTAAGPASMAAALRERVLALDKEMVISHIETMEHRLSGTLLGRRSTTLILGIFAALAMTLAGIGIYGMMSYSTAQRTHEFGVRLALGATRKDVLKLAVGQGLVLALEGVAAAIAAAVVLTRFLASLLFAVDATDAGTFVGVSLLLPGVALLACAIPAVRSAKVDPMVALRYE